MTRKGQNFKDEGKGLSNEKSKVIPVRIDLDTLQDLEKAKDEKESRNSWINDAIKQKLEKYD
jgi:metal-responsive CopG/Arc/MetJ family transcriptional regulator